MRLDLRSFSVYRTSCLGQMTGCGLPTANPTRYGSSTMTGLTRRRLEDGVPALENSRGFSGRFGVIRLQHGTTRTVASLCSTARATSSAPRRFGQASCLFRERSAVEIYGVERRERPVSGTELDAYREYVDAFIPEPQQDAYLDVLDHPSRPTFLPAYRRLIVAPEGHTWALIYTFASLLRPMTWDVFDEARRFVGQVETPKGFWPTSLSEKAVSGVWFDDYGVEHVRVYRRR